MAETPAPTWPPFPRGVAILGATGTVGRKAVDVARAHPERFRVTGLSAHRSVEPLAEAARALDVPRVALADSSRLDALRALLPAGIRAEGGPEAVEDLARDARAQVVVNGIVGRAGLEASLAAVEEGRVLALANKESLVLAGELLQSTARRSGGRIVPVDSEHAGLFQLLEGRDPGAVARLILTASGGPFRGRSAEELGGVTPEEALRHPVWPMGPRITVDSATLLNKGLEVIETRHLFGVELSRIDVWVHPQSIVHSLIELGDGTLLAQVSAPDMLLPVQAAMTYPERVPTGLPPFRLPEQPSLAFESPDHAAFPALKLAYRAAELGGTAPVALNAADEVAVARFLAGEIPFPRIIQVVEEVLDRVTVGEAGSLAAIDEADQEARKRAEERIAAGT